MKQRANRRDEPSSRRLGLTIVFSGFAFLVAGFGLLAVEFALADLLAWWLVLSGAAATGFGSVLVVKSG